MSVEFEEKQIPKAEVAALLCATLWHHWGF